MSQLIASSHDRRWQPTRTFANYTEQGDHIDVEVCTEPASQFKK